MTRRLYDCYSSFSLLVIVIPHTVFWSLLFLIQSSGHCYSSYSLLVIVIPHTVFWSLLFLIQSSGRTEDCMMNNNDQKTV
jgi:hypothetical protein